MSDAKTGPAQDAATNQGAGPAGANQGAGPAGAKQGAGPPDANQGAGPPDDIPHLHPAPPAARRATGYFMILSAVLIWGGWIVATRDQVGHVSPLDLSVIRYGGPALLLAPVWLRRGIVPKGEDWRLIAIMATGWGAPFVLLTGTGLQSVPASLFGPMVPATLPLFVAAWDRFAVGTPIRAERGIGLCLILCSIALVVAPALAAGDPGVPRGAPFLLSAAAGWAAFTIAFRNTGLTGLEATAYTALWSTPPVLAASLVFGSDLPALPWGEIGWIVLSQAILSGVGAVAAFAAAVRLLGPEGASSFTSLVPVVAALGGWAVLGEDPGALGWRL